jgi:hypothetical protein
MYIHLYIYIMINLNFFFNFRMIYGVKLSVKNFSLKKDNMEEIWFIDIYAAVVTKRYICKAIFLLKIASWRKFIRRKYHSSIPYVRLKQRLIRSSVLTYVYLLLEVWPKKVGISFSFDAFYLVFVYSVI